jgi:hypothetical protein
VTVIVEAIPLVGSFDDMVDSLTTAGYEVAHARPDWVDLGSAYCDELGIVIKRADPHTEPQKVDTVGAWGLGYWERWPAEVRSVRSAIEKKPG